jgi:PAS domain S-box-containing protein
MAKGTENSFDVDIPLDVLTELFSDEHEKLEDLSPQEMMQLVQTLIARQNDFQEQNETLQLEISARKILEDQLQNSEERFHSVTQTASDAIITIDERGDIVYWNKAATTTFGYPEEEVLGKQLSLIMPERFQTRHRKGVNRLVSNGKPSILGKVVEMVGLTKEGREFPIELSLASWKVGEEVYFSGILRDITERKHAQQEILNLARFPEENPNPVLRVTLDGTIIYSNEASDPLITSWSSQDGPEIPDAIQQLITECSISGETLTTEIPCGERAFLLDLVPVPGADYVNLYGRDIAEQVQARTLLNEQNQFIVTVFESIDHPFYVIDVSDYSIKMANPATYRPLIVMEHRKALNATP